MTATLVRPYLTRDGIERYSTRAVAEVVGYPVNQSGTSSSMTRWRERLGLSRHGSGVPTRWSLRQATGIVVAAPYVEFSGNRTSNAANRLADRLALNVLHTDAPWLFVTLDEVVEADTVDDLVRDWHLVDTPVGVVVDVGSKVDQVRAALGVVLARHGLPNPYPTHEGATP